MVARSWFPICRRDRSRLPWLFSDRFRWKTMRWPSGWYSAATFFSSANSSFTNSGGRRRRNRDGGPISAASLVSRAHSPCGSGTGPDQTGTAASRSKSGVKVHLSIWPDPGVLLLIMARLTRYCLPDYPQHVIQRERELGTDLFFSNLCTFTYVFMPILHASGISLSVSPSLSV